MESDASLIGDLGLIEHVLAAAIWTPARQLGAGYEVIGSAATAVASSPTML